MTWERGQKLVVTDEARVLKQIRESKGMTMQQAATAIGKSRPYMAHIERGRLDVPQGDKLIQILGAYGVTNYQAFYDRIRNFKERVTPRDELIELASRLPEEKVQVLLGLAKALAEGRPVVSY